MEGWGDEQRSKHKVVAMRGVRSGSAKTITELDDSAAHSLFLAKEGSSTGRCWDLLMVLFFNLL
jgi:hypothetical protein